VKIALFNHLRDEVNDEKVLSIDKAVVFNTRHNDFLSGHVPGLQ
jgi:hypothetical protein